MDSKGLKLNLPYGVSKTIAVAISEAMTQGAHHIRLTVPDIASTRDFFVDVLGFKQVGEKPDYPAVFVSDGTVMLTLWQAQDPQTATPCDRKTNIGLHHFALKVASLEALHAVQ